MEKNVILYKNSKTKLFLKKYILFSFIIIVFFIDYITKKLVFNNLILYEVKPIFTFLNIFYNRNYGIVFGMLSKNNYYQNIFFSIISIIIIIILIFQLYKFYFFNYFQSLAYVLLIGGGLGNLFDRIYYSFVIDFIDFHIKDWHFATFNLADFSIFLGLLIKILDYLFIIKKQ